MDTFSIGGAWSFGYRFFAQRLWLHLLVLIGIGVILPLALQFALLGQLTGISGPIAGQNERNLTTAPTMSLVQAAGYLLQLTSYFASWRLGFAPGQRLGGALLFGLLAALLATFAFALVGTPALFAIGASFSSGIPFLGLLVGLIALVLVFSVFYTLPAAMLATLAAILLTLSMLLGTIMGNAGLAATMIGGGSGAVVVLFLVLSVILLWLTTRLSCTTSVMADRKSYNLLAAIRESWRLTLEDQWAILRYLLLMAFGLGVFFVAVAMIGGLGATAFLQGRTLAPEGQLAILLFGLVIGIPFALLNVAVPAGIYRDLTRSSLAAEVFA